jgi:hypothetical protein
MQFLFLRMSEVFQIFVPFQRLGKASLLHNRQPSIWGSWRNPIDQKEDGMTKRVILALTFLLGGVVLSAGTGYPADTLGFLESYSEKVACQKVDKVRQCDVVDSGWFTVGGEVSLEGVDVSQFNSDTPFHLNLGGFLFDAVLGNDPDYATGDHKAKFLFTDSNARSKTIKYLKVNLHWNARQLRIFVHGRTPDFLRPIMAGDYVGFETGGISDMTTAHLEFGDPVKADFDVSVSGYVHTRPVEKWTQQFEVSNVWLMGVGTPVAPPDPPEPKCLPYCYPLPDGTCECPQ